MSKRKTLSRAFISDVLYPEHKPTGKARALRLKGKLRVSKYVSRGWHKLAQTMIRIRRKDPTFKL